MRTLHIAQGKSFSTETIRCPVDIYNWFFANGNPNHPVSVGMCLLNPFNNLVNRLDRWLTERVDIGARYLTEVDRTAYTIIDVMIFLAPLVRLEQSA